MSKNPPLRNGEENEKVIRNPHADPDHHQKLTTSGGSPLALTTSGGSPLADAREVWSMSVSAFVSYPVYSMTESTTEWQTERS